MLKNKKMIIIILIIFLVICMLAIITVKLIANKKSNNLAENNNDETTVTAEELEKTFSKLFENVEHIAEQENVVYLAYDIKESKQSTYDINAKIPQLKLESRYSTKNK